MSIRACILDSRAFLVCSFFAVLLCASGIVTPSAWAQKVVSYGADFLSGGVGGRALGMGGAHVALAEDVSAGYWNAAGLSRLFYPEVAYMHAERFAGVVSFDYGSIALPINSRSTFGISFFRSGVNDIKNTLDAWDPERNQPRPNPEDHITSFSAADFAFFLSYARMIREDFAFGVSGKIIRRNIGDFADAWGYSFDVGVQYRIRRFVVGANLQDAAGMRQSWSVNQGALQNIQDVFGEELPQGGVEVVLPVARLGTGYLVGSGDHQIVLGADVDLAFDGQRAYALNAGDVSFHPRLGSEYSYKGVIALRAGISNLIVSDRYGWNATPSVGAGFQIKQLAVDYGFGDFAGLASDLGYSHRISARLTINQDSWRRAE